MKFAEDPVDRYKRLASAPATTSSAGLTPDALAKVMSDSETVEHPDKLAEHIAQHSRLTVAEAKTAVGAAVSAQGSTELKATAVSQAVAAATATADIELSDPVMLYPWVRLASALALFCSLGGCIFCIDQLGGQSGVPGSALIGLAVIAMLAIIGVVVLVMGYKNVKITGGSGS